MLIIIVILNVGIFVVLIVLLLLNVLSTLHRMIITEVLGDLQFNFYHRWFDVIFLVSAVLSIIFLYIAHKQSPEKSLHR